MTDKISASEIQYLDKLRAGFINLRNYPPLLEIVSMSVLDPLLLIADFSLAPFSIKSEQPVELVFEDDGVIIKGRIDPLLSYSSRNA